MKLKNIFTIISASLILTPMVTFAEHHCQSKTTHVSKQSYKQLSNVVDTAIKAEQFPTLVAALRAAGLVSALTGEGPFTVFAPTEEAFNRLPEGTLESLLMPENKEKLQEILKYHVVSGSVPAREALKLTEAEALNGKSIDFKVLDGSLYLNSSKVVKTDIHCSNGVVHVIDTVLLP